MEKKGIADIFVVIFLILIALILIPVVWNISGNVIREQLEISEAKSKMMTEIIKIKNVEGDLSNPSTINITLSKGPGKLVVINATNITTSINVDVISVIDLSGSMDDDCNPSSCESNCDQCIGSCKICDAKQATKSFIDNVLNITGNRIGLVGYEEDVDNSDCHDLSDDAISLKNKADSWQADGWTCICCGINKAIEYLELSENSKVMVVMSDGDANRECAEQGTNDSKQDAIQAAKEAYENDSIRVYAVGFGTGADETTLQSIANAGNGNYYFANITGLEEIYAQISEEIVEYGTVEIFDHLKIIFYSETGSYEEKITDLPSFLETKKYQINLEGKITNIIRIEIYLVTITKSGRQVIGGLLDVWEVG